MADDQKTGWPPKNAAKVAEVLDWMRRGMDVHGDGLVLVAIGANSICYSKSPKLSATQAAEILWRNQDAIQRGLELLRVQEVTRGFCQREDKEGEV